MARIFSDPRLYPSGPNRAYFIAAKGALIFTGCFLWMQFLYGFYYTNHISPGPKYPAQMEREFRQRGSKAHGTWTMNIGHTMNGVDHYPITWFKHIEEDDVQYMYDDQYIQEEASPALPWCEISEKDEEVIRMV